MRRLMLIALLAVGAAQAAPMNKCVDDKGHVTFTQQACPGGIVEEAITVKSASAGMSLGPSRQMEAPPRADRAPRTNDVVTIGDGSSGCDSGSDQEARTAIVKNEIYVGMTAKQATQSWGPPSKINRSSSGSDQWVYYRGNAVMDFIYVDQAGCVTAWN